MVVFPEKGACVTRKEKGFEAGEGTGGSRKKKRSRKKTFQKTEPRAGGL